MENQKKKDLAKIALAAFMLSASLPAAGNAAMDAGAQGTVLAGGGCAGASNTNKSPSHSCGASSGRYSPSSSHCGAAPSSSCGAIPRDDSYGSQREYSAPTGKPVQPGTRAVPQHPQAVPQHSQSQSQPGYNRPFGREPMAAEDTNVNRPYGMKPQNEEMDRDSGAYRAAPTTPDRMRPVDK